MNLNPWSPPVAKVTPPAPTVANRLKADLQAAKAELAQVLGGQGVGVANAVFAIAVKTTEAVLLGALPSPVRVLLGGLVTDFGDKLLAEGESVMDKALETVAAKGEASAPTLIAVSPGGAVVTAPAAVAPGAK